MEVSNFGIYIERLVWKLWNEPIIVNTNILFIELKVPISSIMISADDSLFVSGSSDFSFKLWNLKQRKCVWTVEKAHNRSTL